MISQLLKKDLTFPRQLPGWRHAYEKASIKPLPIRVVIMLRHRKMKPIVPKPPNSPFFGTNLHGPSIKKLAIPLEAEKSVIANLAQKNGSKISSDPVINSLLMHKMQSKICICGTLSRIGSEMYNSF